MGQVAYLLLILSLCLNAELIKPIPRHLDIDQKKAALGKTLFFDPVLSRDGTISCVTCHDLQHGGDDGLRFSFGIEGKQGKINAPTVYNAVFNFRQFWDGRARNLEEQVIGPISNPVEMGHDMSHVVEKLRKDPVYRKRFEKVYPDGITEKNVANAIAEFEKMLITPNAPFDRYLRGDKNAISEEAKEGYRLFKYKGCIICHNGVNIGGNLYNRFGIYKDANSSDLGRYKITGREEDKYVFKVPSLRNVARTAPYMHDGRFKTLEEAVKFMTQYQLGRYIEPHEIQAIVAFLKTLSGELPHDIGERE
jgi:cytochrome c peroxidase